MGRGIPDYKSAPAGRKGVTGLNIAIVCGNSDAEDRFKRFPGQSTLFILAGSGPLERTCRYNRENSQLAAAVVSGITKAVE